MFMNANLQAFVPTHGDGENLPAEFNFDTWDGARIHYRAWIPNSPASRAVLLFHRGHEHSARRTDFARTLITDGIAVFAWDQRGHGKSDGDRGCAPDLATVIRDADRFARHVAEAHGIPTADTAVVASSVGAVVAAAWVHDYAPPVRGLVLAAAAFEVKLYVPGAIPFLRTKEKLLPGGKVKSFVKSSMLTGLRDQQRAYDRDPLIFRQIAVNLLLDMHDTGRRLVADAAAITTPTLLLVAGRDWVVKRKAQLEFFKRLGSLTKQFEFFADGRHALFHDTVAPAVTATVRGFLDRCLAEGDPEATASGEPGTASRIEYDLLRTPPSLRWRLMRRMVKLGGHFSDGIRLGLRSGFDSGQTLDYVYRNKSGGRTLLGRLVDRNYLNAIGWRGIRDRRDHLDQLLRLAVKQTAAAGRPVHVLDVAAGAGRYVLEMMRDVDDVTAELRDYRQENLDAAAALARSLGVDRVTFKLADAFDREMLASATPRPSIAIVSGLYELFPENDAVRGSLAGIADAVADGGFLIYTGQPWHPQVEFIARTLTNREGQPWVMRRRSQAEMDGLVRAAGFEKFDQLIDRWGIFTVSPARRVRR
jgi:alpha-beta hydrolase superfamily lysophospholipase/SAM-dependent methyltransferase